MNTENNNVEEKTTKILLNICYGGWAVSDKAKELYEQRKAVGDVRDRFFDYEIRHDPILVQIYEELGEEFNDKYCNVGYKEIPEKYENYYTIYEYDGKESIVIDYVRYNHDKLIENMKKILKNNMMTNDDKITNLELLLTELESRVSNP